MFMFKNSNSHDKQHNAEEKQLALEPTNNQLLAEHLKQHPYVKHLRRDIKENTVLSGGLADRAISVIIALDISVTLKSITSSS